MRNIDGSNELEKEDEVSCLFFFVSDLIASPTPSDARQVAFEIFQLLQSRTKSLQNVSHQVAPSEIMSARHIPM